MLNNVEFEVNKLTTLITQYWSDNVSDIHVSEIMSTPFDMFTIEMKFYGKYDVIMEYERSTLGISLKRGDEYIILSKLTDKPIFRGLKSYITENILHNFNALDRMLQSL